MARALAAAAPGIGSRASGPPLPLSRLPDVPSMFGPPGDPIPTVPSPSARESARPHVAAPKAPAHQELGQVIFNKPRGAAGAGGTLSSPAAPAVVDPPVNVVFAAPKASFGETLPSKEGSRGKASGPSSGKRVVSVNLVVVLVLGALVAGFLLGWSVGRM